MGACGNYLKGWENQSDEIKEEEGRECRETYPRGINLMIIATTDLANGSFGKEFQKRYPIFVTFKQLLEEFLTGECPRSLIDNILTTIRSYNPLEALVWLFILIDVEKDGGVVESVLFTTPISERYRM
jgi:hypothetical protein